MQTAKLLTSAVKDKGEVCRFGGEEFIIVLENIDRVAAEAFANTLCEQVQQLKLKCNNTPLNTITFSIGISFYPTNGKCIDELFNAADQALYQAKETGRNKLVVKE